MGVSESPDIDGDDRQRIYAYVEAHGSVPAAAVADAVGLDPDRALHHVSILKRDGHLEERGGDLQVVLGTGEAEEHRSDGLTFRIRPARQEDISGVIGAIRAVADEKTSIVAESVAEQVAHEGTLIRNNDVSARVFFVATVDDEVVGWVHLQGPRLEKLRHTAKLTVGVLSEYRRRGIGSHLLQRGLEWAAANGYHKVYNSVPATNAEAIRFLEAHGWHTEAIRRDHYRIGDAFVDEVMLAITIG